MHMVFCYIHAAFFYRKHYFVIFILKILCIFAEYLLHLDEKCINFAGYFISTPPTVGIGYEIGQAQLGSQYYY